MTEVSDQELPWAPDHPVLTVLRARRAAGGGPGRHADGHKLGLTVEGGGMRGIVSCAMLSALCDTRSHSTSELIRLEVG